jgi:hypothetical protein
MSVRQQASRGKFPLQFLDSAIGCFRAIRSFHPPKQHADGTVFVPDRPSTNKHLRIVKRIYSNRPVEIGQVSIENRRNSNIAHMSFLWVVDPASHPSRHT